MDHIRQKTLPQEALQCLVLDEADEMLRMGFIDDIEWILEQLPKERQMIFFSATMPSEIRRLSKRFLKDPAEITIKTKKKVEEFNVKFGVPVFKNPQQNITKENPSLTKLRYDLIAEEMTEEELDNLDPKKVNYD